MTEWLKISLQALPTQTAGGTSTATPEQLEEFHKMILRERVPYRDVNKAVRDFAKLYR